MNHCQRCGHPVSRGRNDAHASNHKQAHHCLVCIQARVMKDWRYKRATRSEAHSGLDGAILEETHDGAR